MTSFFLSHGFSPGLARIQSMLESNSSGRRVDPTAWFPPKGGTVTDPPWGGSNRLVGFPRSWGGHL